MRTLTAMLAMAVVLAAGGARAENGVSDAELVLGMSGPFTGSFTNLGVERFRGVQAAFDAANAAGGVHGRKIKLVLADDQYDGQKAAGAAMDLIVKQKVFAMVMGVGTPTLVKALPVVLKFHQTDGLFYFGNATGAQAQREPPYDRAVFNVRVSYREESAAAVDAFLKMGRKKLGVFVQDDAFGTAGKEGAKKALADKGMSLAAETSYAKGQKFEVSTEPQIKVLKEAGVEAVLCAGAYGAFAALVRDARLAGWNVPFHFISFGGAEQMIDLLQAEEKKTGKKLITNLLFTQVVPSYTDLSVPLVKEYRAAVEKFDPKLPAGFGDQAYKAEKYSYGALEGFMTGKAFLAVLEKAGKDLTHKGFIAAAEAMSKFDLGLGAPASFSPTRHQALDKMWFAYPVGDGWATTEDPSSIIK
jgi:ABC-type branched-subunit amino acid transport system substrate-binding protein